MSTTTCSALRTLHARLSEFGLHAELAFTGGSWSARVTIRQRGKRRATRVSEHGGTPEAAARACAAGVNDYLRSWGEAENADAARLERSLR